MKKVLLWSGFVLGIIIISFPSFILVERVREFGGRKSGQTEKKIRHSDSAAPIKTKALKDNSRDSYPKNTDKGVIFRYKSNAAKKVSVSGTFNNWSGKNGTMSKKADGIWEVSIPIKPGKYTYKLKADGIWFLDPGNPASADDGKGGRVSVLIVE